MFILPTLCIAHDALRNIGPVGHRHI